jgi:hypothetical protein
MDLAPINASPLSCQEEERGKRLFLLDPNGNLVVHGTLGKLAKPAYAVFESAEGRWHMERAGHRKLAILDSTGNAVATVRNGKVILADGETFAWEWVGGWGRDSFRLGELCESEPGKRSFGLQLSEAMLGREDRNLLTGIASILIQDVMRRRRRWAFLRFLGP